MPKLSKPLNNRVSRQTQGSDAKVLLPNLSVEQRHLSLDVAKRLSYYDAIVGNTADVASGYATYSSIQLAHDTLPAGSIIKLLARTYSGSVNISKPFMIEGSGIGTGISGTLTLASGAVGCTVRDLKATNYAFNAGSANNHLAFCFQATGGTFSDSGTNNRYLIITDDNLFRCNYAVYQ